MKVAVTLSVIEMEKYYVFNNLGYDHRKMYIFFIIIIYYCLTLNAQII